MPTLEILKDGYLVEKSAGINIPNTTYAWNVNFNNGNVNNNNKTNNNYVRPVRGGPCAKKGPFSFANIYKCYLKCRKRKRNTINALRFEMHLEDNLCKLERELKSKTYQPARSIYFVAKKPKLREIFAADFRDRVAHHILVDYLERIYEPIFIYDSYSCRKNKGTHKAVLHGQKFLRQLTKNGTKRAYYLKLDIKSFFVNIDKNILFGLIKKKTSNSDVLWLLEKILFNDCTKNYVFKGNPGLSKGISPYKTLFNTKKDTGLPIGNLTSQFFANVYLNELDQFVKHNLKCKYYIRYTDDFVLLSESKEQLSVWRNKIEEFLETKLSLSLNPKVEQLRPVSNGIDFIGYIVRAKYILVRRRVINNCKSKLRQAGNKEVELKNGIKMVKFSPEIVKKVNEITASYWAHFNYANSYKLKNSLLKKFEFIEEFKNYFDLTIPHYFSSLCKQYQFFKDAIKQIVYKYDENGQMYFESIPSIIFFQIGWFYELYGSNSKNTHFPVYSEDRYTRITVSKGYSVYVIRQRKDIRFNHKLLPRVLTRKYMEASYQ